MNQSPRIHIIEVGQSERSIELRGTATVGRETNNDIVLDEITVSRCHALLLARPEGIALVDLESTNGTRVNDTCAPPDELVPLKDGDVITLGRVVLRYHAARSEIE